MACGVQTVLGHDNRADVDLARTGIPALPACPGGVVVPRLERGATAAAHALRGASVKTLHLRAAVATAGVVALLMLHLGAAGAGGAVAMAARALGGAGPARPLSQVGLGAAP